MLRMLRTALPFILVFLAVFTAGCIAYIAWELSADKSAPATGRDEDAPASDD